MFVTRPTETYLIVDCVVIVIFGGTSQFGPRRNFTNPVFLSSSPRVLRKCVLTPPLFFATPPTETHVTGLCINREFRRKLINLEHSKMLQNVFFSPARRFPIKCVLTPPSVFVTPATETHFPFLFLFFPLLGVIWCGVMRDAGGLMTCRSP